MTISKLGFDFTFDLFVIFIQCGLHSFMKILIRNENLSAQAIGLDRELWILENYGIFQSFNEL